MAHRRSFIRKSGLLPLVSYIIRVRGGLTMSEKNEQDVGMEWKYIVSVGFFGGLMAGLISYAFHWMDILPFGPGIVFQFWGAYDTTAWVRGPLGHFLAISFISLASIGISFIYLAL